MRAGQVLDTALGSVFTRVHPGTYLLIVVFMLHVEPVETTLSDLLPSPLIYRSTRPNTLSYPCLIFCFIVTKLSKDYKLYLGKEDLRTMTHGFLWMMVYKREWISSLICTDIHQQKIHL